MKIRTKIVVLILILNLFSYNGFAQEVEVKEVTTETNFSKTEKNTFPKSIGIINDYSQIYTESQKSELTKILNNYNLPYEISFERYMKCGIGICGQCTLDGSGIRVCLEGPVLNKEQIVQITEIGSVHRDASGRRIKNN